MHMEKNRFGGTFPDIFEEMSNLKELILATNSFSGPLPSNLGHLIHLGEFRTNVIVVLSFCP